MFKGHMPITGDTKMAIRIETTMYEFAHGRKPKGRGSWVFDVPTNDGRADVMAPSMLSFSEACAWVRQTLRRAGYQDATVKVGS